VAVRGGPWTRAAGGGGGVRRVARARAALWEKTQDKTRITGAVTEPLGRDRNREKTRIDGTLIGSQAPSRTADSNMVPRHCHQNYSRSVTTFSTMALYLLDPYAKATRTEDGDHGHGHGHPPPLPPPYAPSQKQRQSQARHSAPLGRQPTSTWPRHTDYEPPHPPLPPSQKSAILIFPPHGPPY